MKIFRSFEEAVGIRNPVVTTGSFDGVHKAHKKILDRLNSIAIRTDGESVLITFFPHPLKVLYPETAGKNIKMINTQEEKIYLLEKAGLDNVIIIEFTREFSKITSEAFVRDVLSEKLRAKAVVAGFNHHFGFNKEGDYRMLWNLQEKYKFEAVEIPEQEVQHESVSSSRIRDAVRGGYIKRANAYLDHCFMVMGELENFVLSFGNTGFVFRKVVIPEKEKLLPPDGIYAVLINYIIGKINGVALVASHGSEDRQVYMGCFEQYNIPHEGKIILFFNKKFSDTFNIDDPGSVVSVLSSVQKKITGMIS